MKRVSLVTAYNSKGQLLLGKRKDFGTWTTPGGKLEENESPVEGARRELKEESGLTPYSLSFVKEQKIHDNLILYLFSAFISGEPVPTSKNDPDDEVEEWKWVDVNGGLESKYYNNLHGPEDIDKNLLKQLFGEKEKGLNKSEDEVYRLLNHNNINERQIALKLGTVAPDHLEQAALDPNPDIYRAAIDHKMFGEDQIYKLLAATQRPDGLHPLEQQNYLFSKPDRIKPHYLDALWRSAQVLPYDTRSKIIDIILTHPFTESNLISSIYNLHDINPDQRLLAIRHQNAPEDVLSHAVDLSVMAPGDSSMCAAQAAITHSNVNKANLIKLINMAIEQPQNSSIQQLAEHTLSNCQLDQSIFNHLMVQSKLRPHVLHLLTCALNGPLGTELNIGQTLQDLGPHMWADNKSKLPNDLNSEHLDHLVNYAAKSGNTVLLNKVLDHKNLNTHHLNILLQAVNPK